MSTCGPGDAMKTIAIISQKGGAGKTTLSVHMATAAALAGHSAAIIDLDPQGTAASWGDTLSISKASARLGRLRRRKLRHLELAGVLFGVPEVIGHLVPQPGLRCAPARLFEPQRHVGG